MDETKSNENKKRTKSEGNISKKVRKFSPKEFRNSLHGDQKLLALQSFLQQIKENSDQDCTLEYLQKNGNIHEIINCMEQDSTLPPFLILEIVNELLLKIASNKLDSRDAAYESCRYLLNNFISAINKMLGLTSSSKERIVVLKLLTTMSTFSSQLAKDILVHVNFNLTNLELITKNTIENKIVRKQFIFFLTALLIEIEYPTLSLLLEKKGLLTSIIQGLQYDEADSVYFMLTAMKNNVLENQFVSKTVKMKTFNTIVIKNIVNLYNWKGPANLKSSKKEEVDALQKAKVSECVHDLLLVLCTSHRHGIIFRDPLVGLGKKTQNALVYTVLESMDSPWEHSYASELVIKICSACPDLTKYVWNNLKSSLEPRYSLKWVNVVNFVRKLLQELKPSCLEPYVKQLNYHQITQLITILVAPLPILKTIIPDNVSYDLQIIRHNVMLIVNSVLESIQSFIVAAKHWLNNEQFIKLKNQTASFIAKNFPSGQALLTNWNEPDKTEETTGYNPLIYLSLVLDIFGCYMDLCPELLESMELSSDDLRIIFETVDSLSSDLMTDERDRLKVKIMDLFLTVNPSVFDIKTSSFSLFLSFLFRISYVTREDRSSKIYAVMRRFLKNNKVFQMGSDREVSIWTNGIYGLKEFSETIPEFFSTSLKLADSEDSSFLKEMQSFIADPIEMSTNEQFTDAYNLSTMIMGVSKTLATFDVDKSIISYLNFVVPNLIFYQVQNPMISHIIDRHQDLSSILSNTVHCILRDEITFNIPKILKVLGKHNIFDNTNLALAAENFDQFLDDDNVNTFSIYPDLKLDLVYMGIFFFSKLLEGNLPEQNIYSENLLKFIDFLLEQSPSMSKIVLKHPVIRRYFSILELNEKGEYNTCTRFLMNFLDMSSKKQKLAVEDLEYLSTKVLTMLQKILKNSKKYETIEISKILTVFKMNLSEYINILSEASAHISSKIERCKYNVFSTILIFSINKYCEIVQCNPQKSELSNDICINVLKYYAAINETGGLGASNLACALKKYLSIAPNNVQFIDEKIITSILNIAEYDKDTTDFLVFILEKRHDFIQNLKNNMDNLINVKGMLYAVFQVLANIYETTVNNSTRTEIQEIFTCAFSLFEGTLHKILRKPQKASQHLDRHYKGVILLVDLNFQRETFREYSSKIQKFDATKTFHVSLLYTIFKKVIKEEVDNSIVNNSILTFVHLLLTSLKKIPKEESDTIEIVDNVCEYFINYLNDIDTLEQEINLNNVQNNESFKLLIKLCLKYGVSSIEKLLIVLKSCISLIGENFDGNQVKLIMEMLFSHSEFLDVVLSENHKCKVGILSLICYLCGMWPQVMERSHVPILLSSYGGTLAEADVISLDILKMYESARNQTSFHDFKPYLWGPTGANHYSVRTSIEKALLKQPRMSNVLEILQENSVLYTIKNYNLYCSKDCIEKMDRESIYDLNFFLPLFSHLLAPENVVQTYHFTRSGALSLSIIGLSSQDHKIRASSCHVLSRFYFHVDARQSGKDNLIWIRLIEVICKAIGINEKFVLNNFAAIFLAKTALILTQPNHVMYLPLSQYLAAKPTLDFSSIPELYTFLHSSDVNFKDHRNFIFEILSEGLIYENDFNVFFYSMALKLFMEMYSSCNCDMEAKLLILNILISICRLPIGVTFITSHNSMLEYLVMDLEDTLVSAIHNKSYIPVLCKLVEIFRRICSNSDKSSMWRKYLISNACERLNLSSVKQFLPQESLDIIVKMKEIV